MTLPLSPACQYAIALVLTDCAIDVLRSIAAHGVGHTEALAIAAAADAEIHRLKAADLAGLPLVAASPLTPSDEGE